MPKVRKITVGSRLAWPDDWRFLRVSNATLSKQFSTGYGYQGLYINPDENVALTAQHNGNSIGTIRGYTYSNKDISTATLEGTKSPVRYIHCVFANKDGTHIYFGTHSDNTIYEYTTTNRSVTDMALYKSKNISFMTQAIFVSKDEKYLVVCNPPDNNPVSTLKLYQMTTPGDVSTATLIKTINNIFNYNCHGIFFNDDFTMCITCEYNASSGKVHQYTCDLLNSDTFTEVSSLGPVGFTIGYANINKNVTKMYASRENGYIYEYTLE